MGQYLSRTGVSEPSGSRHYRPTPTSAQILQFGSDTPVRLRYSSSAQILRYSETPSSAQIIGQLPRVSREDPERIRVDSVFITSLGSITGQLQVGPMLYTLPYHIPHTTTTTTTTT